MSTSVDALLANAMRQAGGGTDGASGASMLITAGEAERMIDQLKAFSIEEVGTAKWMQQHDWVNQLNLQAHHNAMTHSDEFVMEQLVSLDKLGVLIHELLVIEVWKDRVLPLLKDHLVRETDTVTAHLLLYHEAALANLLEICLFHQHACEAVSEDYLMELNDWCHRKLIYLNNDAVKDVAPRPAKSAKELLATTPLDDLEEKAAEQRFGTAICALSILRYLTDYLPHLPMSLTSRMVSTSDMIMALVPLLDSPPWVRRRDRKLERFEDSRWSPVEGTERLRVSKHEAQVWLALNNLLVDPRSRSRYDLDGYRRDVVLKLKKHMHEVLFDQLPVLKDLQRALEEIVLSYNPAGGESKNRLILEQVPLVREGLLKGRDWRAVAEEQKRSVFNRDARNLSRKRIEQLLKTFDFMCSLEADKKDDAAAAEEAKRAVYIETKRKLGDDTWLSYEHLKMELNPEKPSEDVEVKVEGGSVVKGRRYMLRPLNPSEVQPFPAVGKILVKHQGKSVEALLDLPAPITKEVASLPAVLWVTVGILAADGIAVQLKLKRADQATSKDKQAGVYWIYYPVGGAVTVRLDAP